jgi:hypothetical protein
MVPVRDDALFGDPACGIPAGEVFPSGSESGTAGMGAIQNILTPTMQPLPILDPKAAGIDVGSETLHPKRSSGPGMR